MDRTNTTADQTFKAWAATYISHADDTSAVIVCHGQMTLGMTIAQARELSMALAKAADEAELKLPS